MPHATTIALARELLADGRVGDAVRMVEPLIESWSEPAADSDQVELRTLLARATVTEYRQPHRALDLLGPFASFDARARLPARVGADVALWLGWARACRDRDVHDAAQALHLVSEAATRFSEHDDLAGYCWALLGRAQAYATADEYALMEDTVAEAQSFLDRMDDLPARRWWTELQLISSRCRLRAKEADEAAALLKRTAARSSEPFVRGGASAYRCALLLDRGSAPEAVEKAAEEAIQLLAADALPSCYPLLLAHRTRLDARLRAGRWSDLDAVAERVAADVRTVPYATASLRIPRVYVALWQGRYDDVRRLLRTIQDQLHGSHGGAVAAEAALASVHLHRRTGNAATAAEEAKRADRVAAGMGHRVQCLQAQLAQAHVHLDQDEPEAARRLVDELAVAAADFDRLPLLAAVSELQGRLALAEGDAEEAMLSLHRAASAYTLIGDAYHTGRLRLMLARDLGISDHHALEGALATFERLGCVEERDATSALIDTVAAEAGESNAQVDFGALLHRARSSARLVAETWMQEAERWLPNQWMGLYEIDAAGHARTIHDRGASRPHVRPPDEASDVRWQRLGGGSNGPVYYFGATADDETAWQKLVDHLDPWRWTAVLALEHSQGNRSWSTDDAPMHSTSRDEAVAMVLRPLRRRLHRLQETHSPVLLTGEPGTCRESVARAIHGNSTTPFVVADCSAASHERLSHLLFGNNDDERPGLVQQADGGTLFLRNVDHVPQDLHAAVLRLARQGEIVRPAAHGSSSIDIRIVASTSVDFAELVREDRFNEDLYVHLSTISVHLPPLRECRADIPRLARAFLNAGRPDGVPTITLTRPAIDAVLAYEWPGNVRQLRNEMDAARDRVHHEPAPTVDLIDLSPAVREAIATSVQSNSASLTRDDRPLDAILADTERDLIREALAYYDGHVTATAEALGLTRQGLYKKMKRLQIDSSDVAPTNGAATDGTARTAASSR